MSQPQTSLPFAAQPLLPWGQGQRQERSVAPEGAVAVVGKVTRQCTERPGGWRMLLVTPEGAKDPQRWMGVCDRPEEGTIVEAVGRYERDRRGEGEVFRFDTLIERVPDETQGLIAFIAKLAKGVGAGLAKRIVDHFGPMTIDVLDKDPMQATKVPGISEEKAQRLSEAWTKKRSTAAVIIFLLKHGVQPFLARRIAEHFEDRARHIIENEPYRITEVDGIAFARADQIAMRLGIAPDSIERAAAALVEVLWNETFTAGHTFTIERLAVILAAKLLDENPQTWEATKERVGKAIESLLAAERPRIVRTEHDGHAVLQLATMARAEKLTADRLTRLLTTPLAGNADDKDAPLASQVDEVIHDFETEAKIQLAPIQREALQMAARHKVLVLTGGPGTGKSTLLLGILKLYSRAKIPVYLCAPTGRAAKRMNEATGHPSSTIHRMLGFDPVTKGFLHREDHTLPDCGAVIGDEQSMTDIKLCADLLAAIPAGARVIFIGDVDQLPSVGPGAVLRDMIDSGTIPTVRLTQIFRQAEGSEIIDNAHRINAGQKPVGHDGPGGEFYVFRRDDGAGAAALAVELVTRRIPSGFGIPSRDIQLLTPMHRGAAGTLELNRALQAVLNPPREGGVELTRGDFTFRAGDKVLVTKNDAQRDIYNGDLGVIDQITQTEDGRTIVASFDDDRRVAFAGKQLDGLRLAYAMSTHKSQGSTFTAVVQLLLPEHHMLLSRPLLYTGITRPRKLAVLITEDVALRRALRETESAARRTRLVKLLRDRAARTA